jgi:uncharacterized protein YrrD
MSRGRRDVIRKMELLKGYKIHATDGDLGTVHDLFFEDDTWVVRYIVVDTGGWLSGRQVLVSPMAVQAISDSERAVRLDLSKQQIEGSPSLFADQPVSRQFEQAYFDHYDYPYYWYGAAYPYAWGGYVSPSALARSAATSKGRRQALAELAGDVHLRSLREVKGYHIQATDHEVGTVEDFLMDDESWQVRYLLVDTSNWWFGKHVVLPPDWISDVNWVERRVTVDVTRDEVKGSPELDLDALNDGYEERLYGHYRKGLRRAS